MFLCPPAVRSSPFYVLLPDLSQSVVCSGDLITGWQSRVLLAGNGEESCDLLVCELAFLYPIWEGRNGGFLVYSGRAEFRLLVFNCIAGHYIKRIRLLAFLYKSEKWSCHSCRREGRIMTFLYTVRKLVMIIFRHFILRDGILGLFT